jgi:hypothetical protein
LSCCAQRLDPFYLIEEQVFSRGPNTPKLHQLHGDCSGVLVTNGIGTPFVDQICELLDLRFEPGVRRQRDRKPMSERVFRRPQFPRTGPRTSAGARIFSVGDNPCRRFHATFCAPARRGAAESRRRGETRRPAVCRCCRKTGAPGRNASTERQNIVQIVGQTLSSPDSEISVDVGSLGKSAS